MMASNVTETTTSAPEQAEKSIGGFSYLASIVFLSLLVAVLVEISIFRSDAGVARNVAPLRILCWLVFFGSTTAWVLQSASRLEQRMLKEAKTGSKPPKTKRPVVEKTTVAPEDPPAETPELPIRMFVHGGVILPPVVKTSRMSDRIRLSNWLATSEPSIKVVEGRGGMGKSVLLWMWILRNVQGSPVSLHPPDPPQQSQKATVPPARRPEGIFWWSMDEPASGAPRFLDALTEWLGEAPPSKGGNASAYDQIERSIDLLKSRRMLIVLDGFEASLWGQIDPTVQYRADRVTKNQRDEDRGCVDPVMTEFLFRFARLVRSSKIILATRQYPLDLEALDETPTDRHPIEGLSTADCLQWFDADSIAGDRARLSVAARHCGFRPIAIQAAIALAKQESPSKPNVESVLKNQLLARNPTPHAVIRALLAVVPRETRDFLCRLSAFRGILSQQLIEQVAEISRISEVDKAVSLLVDLRLLERNEDRYGIHSLVRAAAYDRLPDAAGFHKSASTILQESALGERRTYGRVDELAVPIEQMHHLALGGEYERARDLYRDEIEPSLVEKFGDHHAAASSLMTLFPAGITAPPALEKGSSQAAAVRALGEAFEHLGGLSRASTLFQLAIQHAHEWKLRKTSDIDYLTLAEAQIRMGRLQAASDSLKRCVLACQAASEELRLAVAREITARLHLIEGDLDQATSYLSQALAVVQRWNEPAKLADCFSTRAILFLVQGLLAEARESAMSAVKLSEKLETAKDSRSVARVRARLVLAQVLSANASHESGLEERREIVAEAFAQIESAFRFCHRQATYEYMPDIHWTRAAIRFENGEMEKAVEDCSIALRLAQRSEARLIQADAHRLFSRICEEQQNVDQAHMHLETARELARCDGAPHCYLAIFESTESVSSS